MDIRQYIRDEIDHGTSLQSRDIADTILGRLSTKQRADALTTALPALVKEVINGTRPSAQRAMTENVADISSGKRTQGRSWKREHFQSGEWRRQLDAIYSTRSGNKRLGDFDADELADLAETCRELAAKNGAAAARWESLESAVRAAGVDRLADLDDGELRDLMGGAA